MEPKDDIIFIKNPFQLPRLRYAALITAVVIVIYVSYTTLVHPRYQAFTFENVERNTVISVFVVLLLISVFVERALEFFVELWRGEEKVKLELDRDHAMNAVKRSTSQKATKESLRDLKKKETALKLYQVITSRITLWTSFIIGLLICAAGVRSLEPIIAPETTNLLETQVILFKVIDVILTAGLISGGSDGIHKITVVYTSFMERTALRVKQVEDRTLYEKS